MHKKNTKHKESRAQEKMYVTQSTEHRAQKNESNSLLQMHDEKMIDFQTERNERKKTVRYRRTHREKMR